MILELYIQYSYQDEQLAIELAARASSNTMLQLDPRTKQHVHKNVKVFAKDKNSDKLLISLIVLLHNKEEWPELFWARP